VSAKRVQTIAKRKRKASIPAVQRLRLFGPPLLLEGEDVATYEALQARICAAIEPTDFIDEVFVNDFIVLQWDVSRWRRLSRSLVNAHELAKLADFVGERLHYELYRDEFVERVENILTESLATEDTEEFIQEAIRSLAEDGDDRKTTVLLFKAGYKNPESVQADVRSSKADEFVQGYERGERKSVKVINDILDSAGRTINSFMEVALSEKLDDIERIDRLTTIAETRRNTCLREIDRRRAALSETLRRSAQEVEDGEFEVIEAMPDEEKNAA
jgi:hypothetical protein